MRPRGHSQGLQIQEIVSEEAKELEFAPPGLPNNEEAVCVWRTILFLLFQWLSNLQKLKSEIDVEGNTVTATASGIGPRKLTVRRHIQNENNVYGTSANNLSQVELSTLVEPNNVLIPAEGSCPRVTSDVSKSCFEDGMLFDHEGLSYEDMEFEPHTYFSFTELLAFDDVMGDWQSLSAVSSNGFPEPCGIRPSNQQEHKISVKPSVDLTTHRVPICLARFVGYGYTAVVHPGMSSHLRRKLELWQLPGVAVADHIFFFGFSNFVCFNSVKRVVKWII